MNDLISRSELIAQLESFKLSLGDVILGFVVDRVIERVREMPSKPPHLDEELPRAMRRVINEKYKAEALKACERLEGKMIRASHQLECGASRVIINLSDQDHTILFWALRRFWDEVENMEVRRI